jgi:hypothetical protein
LYIDGRPIQAHPISTISDFKYSTVGGEEDLYPSQVLNSESEWELMKSLRYHGDVRSSPMYDAIARQNSNAERSIISNIEETGNGQAIFNSQRDKVICPFAVYGIDLEKSDLLSGTSLSNELALQLEFKESLKASYPQINNINFSTIVGADKSFTYKMFMFLHYDKRVILHSGLRVTEME